MAARRIAPSTGTSVMVGDRGTNREGESAPERSFIFLHHVVEIRAVVELPTPVTVLVSGMNGQHARDLAVTCDYVFAGGEWEVWRLHNQAVFFQPPVGTVKFPLCRSYPACGYQFLIAAQPHSARARIYRP